MLVRFSMTVQDGGRDDNQQQYHFQLDANTSPTSFLKYIISTYFFSGEGFLRNKAPQDQLISFSWPCISNQAALTFYPPPQGLITKPTDSSVQKIQLPHYHSIYTTQHIVGYFFVCMPLLCLCLFVGRFQTSWAHGFPKGSLWALTKCMKLRTILWSPAFDCLYFRSKGSKGHIRQIVNTKHFQG